MKTTASSTRVRRAGDVDRPAARAVRASTLTVLAVVLAGLVGLVPGAFARAPGSGTGSEGQGTLPSFEGGVGLALTGSLQDVLAVLGQVTGEGSVEFYALDDTVSMAHLSGDLQVSLDRHGLERLGVGVHLVLGDALEGGIAEVVAGGWRSGLFLLPSLAMELPLADLYGASVTRPREVRLAAMGPERDVYGLSLRVVDDVLTLRQSLR